jgi:ABC-type multidrug transport system ATPase subunit
VGVNGAGKSTFIKLCLGLLKPHSGDILVNSINVNKEKDKVLEQIGVLHENPIFPNWVRIFDYLCWVGRLRGLSFINSIDQANYLIEKLELSDKKNELVSRLSAGLRQRFGLAQAIIGMPKIIFLDEPTANLDVHSRYMVLDFLKEITENYDVKVIFLSHILADLERYCDAFAILHKGEILYHDKISVLIQSTKHKSFIIRGNHPEKLIEFLENLKINIERIGKSEVIIDNLDIDQKYLLEKELPDTYVLYPYRGLLEQKFVELTKTNSVNND